MEIETEQKKEPESIEISKVDWSAIITEIYEKCNLTQVVYEGIPYFPHTTKWLNGVENKYRPASDPLKICDGYSEEECTHRAVAVSQPSNIKMIFNSDDVGINLGVKNPFSIKFVGGVVELNRSPSRENEDHRGSDHFSIQLPFTPRKTLICPFTLKDLIDTLFLMKSHKTDKWYELFMKDSVEANIENLAHVKINFRFDYGS